MQLIHEYSTTLKRIVYSRLKRNEEQIRLLHHAMLERNSIYGISDMLGVSCYYISLTSSALQLASFSIPESTK